MNTVNNINEVELIGKIADLQVRDNFVAIKVSTSKNGIYRESDSKSFRNYPRVVWYGESGKGIADRFKEGDKVRITAEIDTSFSVSDGKRFKRQTLLGLSIEPAESLCKNVFGIEASVKNYTPDVNCAKLKGIVTRIYRPDENKSFVKVTLRIVKNNHFSHPEILFFGRTADFIINNVNLDNILCVTAIVQTYRKEVDGKRITVESLVCNEVALQNSDNSNEAVPSNIPVEE